MNSQERDELRAKRNSVIRAHLVKNKYFGFIQSSALTRGRDGGVTEEYKNHPDIINHYDKDTMLKQSANKILIGLSECPGKLSSFFRIALSLLYHLQLYVLF